MIEGSFYLDLRAQGQNMREANQESHGDDVIGAGLDEAVPGEPASHEHVGPERGRGRAQIQRRKAAGKQAIAQIAKERTWPRRQFDQKPRNGLALLDLNGWRHRGHISPY